MGSRGDRPGKGKADLWFLDELEPETEQLKENIPTHAWDGHQRKASDASLLEFADDDRRGARTAEREEPSEPVRIYVGRVQAPATPKPSSWTDALNDAEDSQPGALETGPVESGSDSGGTLPGPPRRTPAASEDGDDVWGGLGSLRRRDSAEGHSERPSWLGMPSFNDDDRAGATEEKWNTRERVSVARTSRPSGGIDLRRTWQNGLDEDPSDGVDEVELPVHQPLRFGTEEPAFSEGEDVHSEPVVEEDSTGSWNRLSLFTGSASASLDGLDGERPDGVEMASPTGGYSHFPAEPEVWTTADADVADARALGTPDAGEKPPARLPPIEAMGSVLREELNSRTPVQPKAVVLKTLDGISNRPDSVDEPSDLGSRIPTAAERSGRVDSEESPVQVSTTGSGRLLLLVAVAVLCTLGAMWQWRSSLFPQDDLVSLDKPGAQPAVIAPEPEAQPSATEAQPSTETDPPEPVAPAPSPTPPAPEPVVPPVVSTAAAQPSEEVAAEERAKIRERRRAALNAGVLYVSSDRRASVYVDGRKVGTTPMELPGVELRAGHYDVKVVPHGRGRTYRTNTRIDAGRVRNIELTFNR